MKQQQTTQGWTLILEKGELLIESLTDFCKREQITAGWLHGLGAALETELGYYQLDQQRYEFKTLDEVLEIASLHGNIALKDGQPFVHAHVLLSDADLRCYGGHLKELTVGGTCEVNLQVESTIWRRIHDETVGLDLIGF